MNASQILLDCGKVFLGNAPPGAPATQAAKVNEISQAASREGMLGLVAHVLSPSDLAAGQLLRQEALRNLIWTAEIARIDRGFQRVGLEAMVLKGGAMLSLLYQDALAVRFLSDLDLLVRPEDLAKAGQTLRGLGYRGDGSGFLHRELGLAVDLHHEPFVRLPGAFGFSPARIWSDSCPLDPARYGALRAMCAEDSFLYACVHALKHGYSKAMWIIDLALMSRLVDPQLLWSRAVQSRCERAVFYALVLCEAMFKEPLDARFHFAFLRLNFLERKYLDGVALRRMAPDLGKLVMVFSVPGWSSRLALLWSLLSPRGSGLGWLQRLSELRSKLARVITARRAPNIDQP